MKSGSQMCTYVAIWEQQSNQELKQLYEDFTRDLNKDLKIQIIQSTSSRELRENKKVAIDRKRSRVYLYLQSVLTVLASSQRKPPTHPQKFHNKQRHFSRRTSWTLAGMLSHSVSCLLECQLCFCLFFVTYTKLRVILTYSYAGNYSYPFPVFMYC